MIQNYPKTLLQIIHYLKKLPGVGTKTAERFAFQLLKWSSSDLEEFSYQLRDLKKNITTCADCGCLMNENLCSFCSNKNRDHSLLCILSSPRDVFAMEATSSYKGYYHIIEHLLSPLDNRQADQINLEKIYSRIQKLQTKEVILAFDSTLEGDTTALFLKQRCSHWGVNFSRLALGLPVGSSLEYIDEGTLSRALMGRQAF